MTPRERTLEIVREVGERYNICLRDLLSDQRHRPVAWARFHCYAELYSRGMTASEIGRVFNRDHSTILHGLKRAAEFQYNMFPRWACPKRAATYSRHCNSATVLYEGGRGSNCSDQPALFTGWKEPENVPLIPIHNQVRKG